MRMDRRAGLLSSGLPSLKQLFIELGADGNNNFRSGRNSSSASYCRVRLSSYSSYLSTMTIFMSIYNGYIGIYEWDPVNMTASTTPLYRSSTSYCGWYNSGTYFSYAHSPGATSYSSVYGATLLWARFPSYSNDIVNQVFSNITATKIAGRNANTSATSSYNVSDYSTENIILLASGDYIEPRDASTDTVVSDSSEFSSLSSLSGSTRTIQSSYGHSIIGLTSN